MFVDLQIKLPSFTSEDFRGARFPNSNGIMCKVTDCYALAWVRSLQEPYLFSPPRYKVPNLTLVLTNSTAKGICYKNKNTYMEKIDQHC